MHWLWFALISVTLLSVSSLFQRLAMKEEDSDPITSAIIFQLLMAGLSTIAAFAMGFHLPSLSLWPYFLISGGLYALGTLSFFRAIKILEASEIAILNGAGTLVPIVFAFFFLSEQLTPAQWVGAAVIVAAIIIVKYEKTNFRFNKGVWFALLGTTCYGIAVVSDGFILRSYDTFSFVPIINLLPASILIISFPKKIRKLARDVRTINMNLAIYSFLYVIAAESFYIPLRNGAMVSQIATITKASIIITVILSMIFLKERTNAVKKLSGAILTTIGIYLMR